MKLIRVLVVWLGLAPALYSQPVPLPVPESATVSSASEQTYKRLSEIERKLLSQKSLEALEELQRLVETAGDDLVAVPTSPVLRPTRHIVHSLLIRMPPEILASYRAKMDLPAQELVREGLKNRDPKPFQRAVQRYFPARPCEEALFWLGEHAFQAGEFRAAEEHWRRILSGGESTDPQFPDPAREAASIFARVILAEIFQRELKRAATDLAKFKERYPEAKGQLAGKNARYLDILEDWLNRSVLTPPATEGEAEWTTLAGDFSRSAQVIGRLPYYWPGQPAWKVTLPPEQGRTPIVPKVAPSRSLGLHLVVMDGIAYVSDATRIFGYDLRTGRQQFFLDVRRVVPTKRFPKEPFNLPMPEVDFSLSVGGGQLFARLGDPGLLRQENVLFPAAVEVPPPTSYLLGLLPGYPAKTPLEVRWTLPPPVPPGTPASWEGAPVWHQRRIYATFIRDQGNRAVVALACYEDQPDEPVWVTDLVEIPPSLNSESKVRHELLTLAGDQLVYCSHAGVVISVNLHSGKPSWAFRYPKLRPSPDSVARDLCPAVADAGRIFVAPTDSDQLFALDALTGRLLWQSDSVQIDHILGVTRGKLIAAVNAPVRGIRAWNVENGIDRSPYGWRVHDDPQLGSYGRGLVSEQMILWPTSSGIFFLSPVDGTLLRAPIRYPHGNLSFAAGVMLVGRATEVWAYVAERLDLPARLLKAKDEPWNRQAQQQLAYSLADAGRWTEAAQAIDQAEPLVDAAQVKAEWFADRLEIAASHGQLLPPEPALNQTELPAAWRARLERRRGTAADEADYLAFVTAEGRLLRPGDVNRELSPTERRPREDHDGSNFHAVPPGASIREITRFPNSRCVPLLPFQGESLPGLEREQADPDSARLLVTDGEQVYAYKPRAAASSWTLKLPAGLVVTRAAAVGDSIIAAGPRGAIRFRLADGQLEWANLWATVDPLTRVGQIPTVRTTTLVHQPTYTKFALTGSRLIVLAGPNLLLAYDLAHGAVAWVINAKAEPRIRLWTYPGSPQFSPEFLADDDFVLLQTSLGERWTVRTHDGKLLERAASAMTSWTGPPTRLLNGLYVLAEGPEQVQGVEANYSRWRTAKVRWSLDLQRPTSATGQPPQLFPFQDSLVLGVFRNHGYELERIRDSNGDRIWPDMPPLLVGDRFQLSDAKTDGRLLFVSSNQTVYAIRLADGLNLWRTPLEQMTTDSWQIRPALESIVVYPREPIATDRASTLVQQTFNRLPRNFWRLPSLPAILYDASMDQRLPMYWLDPKRGEIVHRLEFPVGPVQGVHLGHRVAVVATAGQAFWLSTR